jgi:hypothetical protein
MGDAHQAAPAGSTAKSIGSTARIEGEIAPAASIIEELVAVAQSAAAALAEEQKLRGAERAADAADAVRRMARCFDQSQVPRIGDWADQAAGQIDRIAQLMRTRGWDEIVADAEAATRRQPALFVLAAVAAGFVAGRLLAAPAESPGAATDAPTAGVDVPAQDAAASRDFAETAARGGTRRR